MKAHVYFQKSYNGDDVKRVAEVEIPAGMITEEALEFVYGRLQNIRGSWSMGPTFEFVGPKKRWDYRGGEPNYDYSEAVKFVGEYPEHCDGSPMGERSMMVGDLVVMDGKTYEVAVFGFEEYQEEEVA